MTYNSQNIKTQENKQYEKSYGKNTNWLPKETSNLSSVIFKPGELYAYQEQLFQALEVRTAN